MIFRSKGYLLLEVLIAFLIVNLIISLAFRYQNQVVQKSWEQFQELWAINQLDNLLQRLQANPLAKEQEFKIGSLENVSVIPQAETYYRCNVKEQCEVSLQWNHEKLKLGSL